jgi:imidazolonepropionase-like amidohydrolase
MMRTVLVALVAPWLLLAQETIAITGAHVIDGTGAAPRAETVLVRGDRIAAVGPDIAIPIGARILKADGLTLLPGLFDLHTHLSASGVNRLAADWGKNLAAYLVSGVTTVADLGTYPETFAPMRELLNSGTVPGPHVLLAARFTTPGGHGAEAGRGDFFSQEVLTPREARAAVQRMLPYRPDLIKVFTDGWRYGVGPEMTSMNEETLTALVEEAHKNGIRVLTHTVTLERAKIAARAGVDVLAHGVGDAKVDDELIGLLKQKGTFYVSTLAVYEPRRKDILSPLLVKTLEPAAIQAIEPPLTPVKSAPPVTDHRPKRRSSQCCCRMRQFSTRRAFPWLREPTPAVHRPPITAGRRLVS